MPVVPAVPHLEENPAMSAPTHPTPTPPEPDQPSEFVFAASPAEAYARAFARAGVPVRASLTVRLPLQLSAAGDDELHRLLAQLDDREAALTLVRDRLARLPEKAEARVLYGPLLRCGLESTAAVRECLLTELNWRTDRTAAATAEGVGPGSNA